MGSVVAVEKRDRNSSRQTHGAALRFLRLRATQSWFPARHLWHIVSPGLNSHLTYSAVKCDEKLGKPIEFVLFLTLSDLQWTQAPDLCYYVNAKRLTIYNLPTYDLAPADDPR
jgi:hypothetical protein